MCIFCAWVSGIPMMSLLQINVIFTCLPHPLDEINKDSVLVCLLYPVLSISIVLEASSVLGTENVFIKYLD